MQSAINNCITIYTGCYFCVMFQEDSCDNFTKATYCFITEELALQFVFCVYIYIIKALIK